MATKFSAANETWDVHLSPETPRPGVRVVIFRCETNSSTGWRVVEVPAGDFPTAARVAELSESELRALFDRSQPFDYSHDPKAHPDHIEDTPGR